MKFFHYTGVFPTCFVFQDVFKFLFLIIPLFLFFLEALFDPELTCWAEHSLARVLLALPVRVPIRPSQLPSRYQGHVLAMYHHDRQSPTQMLLPPMARSWALALGGAYQL
jgi:hypothetical protein